MELQSLGKYRLVAPLHDSTDAGFPSETQVRRVGLRARPSSRFYLAHHTDEPEDEEPSYVVKLLIPEPGERGRRRRLQFEHETRLLQAFNHASIPTAHAAGDQDGIAYVVMDRVEGLPLRTLLGHDGPQPRALPKEVAVYVAAQIVDALVHIHGVETMEDDGPRLLGVVHRNLSPENVLLSRSGDAVLCGFGSARSRWLPGDGDDAMAGDPAYMAPERVARNGEATPGTDLFAIAVVLWEMLKGQRCLAGSTLAAVLDNINRFDVGQPSRRIGGLSSKLGEIVRKNLDRDPARRYADAYQMLQRLAQAPEAQAAEQARVTLAEMVQRASA